MAVGWGRETFGNLGWGVNYSVIAAGPNGLSASIITGNEDAFIDVLVEVNGNALQTAVTPVGTQANADHEIAVSLLLTSTQGDVTTEVGVLVEPTGIALSTDIGEAVGGTIQEVPVTGVSATLNLGNSDQIGTANVDLTGIGLSANLGTVIPVSKYEPGSVEATISAGQVTLTGDAVVIPTGIALTANQGSPNITAWAEIDPGVTNTWTVVDLAA